jgi:iron complex outermembrane receptor protein
MKQILFFTALLLTTVIQAQTRGKVIDSKTSEPIPGATVRGAETVTTDSSGEFSVSGGNEIAVSYVGYETSLLRASGNYLIVALRQSTLMLSEVVVNAFDSKRALLTVAASVSVISKADLNRGDNTTLIPILNAVPGVKLDYYTYGDYRLNIRGGALAQPSVHASGYRMYWNDIPITLASGGNALGGLDVNFINNIEIIKGPGSSMYGAGFGGTVLVNTEKGTGNGTVVSTDNMYGGYKTFRSSTGLRSDFSKGNIALQYTHTESDGFRPMTNTNSNVYNLAGQFYTGRNGELSYLVNYENRIMNIAGDLDSATFKDAPTSFNTVTPTGFGPNKFTTGIGYQFKASDKWTLGTSAYYLTNKGEFVLSFPFFAIFDKENYSGLNTRTTASYRDKWRSTGFRFIAGIEAGVNNSEIIAYNGDFHTDTAQIMNRSEAKTGQFLGFAQTEFHFENDLFFTAGVSYNRYGYEVEDGTNTPNPSKYDESAHKLIPRFSLLKKWRTVSVYLAAGQGFTPPASGDFLNYNGTINNDIKPSSGWNYEVGSRGSSGNGAFFYDVSYYNLRVKDAIISQLFEVSQNVNVEKRTNAGEVRQVGVEALVGWNLARETDNFFNGSQFRAGYTFNDYNYIDYKTFRTDYDQNFDPIYVPVDYSGKEVPGTIRHSWLLMLDVKTKPGFYINYTLNRYGDTYLTNENVSKVDAYALMNLRVGFNKTVAKGRLAFHPYAGINNVGNTLYSSLTAYNNTFGGYFNPGYRRQFFGGMQLNFFLKR